MLPSGPGSGRSYFNLDWITLLVMAVVTVAGIIVHFAVHAAGRSARTSLTPTRRAPRRRA